MPMKGRFIKASVVFSVFSCFATLAAPTTRAQKAAPKAPVYRVDPFWPKPLPNQWSMQEIVDIHVDKDGHIWALNRPDDARPDELGAATNPPRTECCVLGPEVLEFDADGNLLKAWGKKDYVPGWPKRLQTIGVDRDLNVYVSGTAPGDSIIKLTQDGKLLWDFGHRGPVVPASQVKQDNQQTEIFPPGIGAFDFDEDAREIYVADGFLNKRVLVYDMETGAFKRGWGGHGTPLNEIETAPRLPTTFQVCRPIRSSSRPSCTACIPRATASSMSANGAATAFRCSPSKANSSRSSGSIPPRRRAGLIAEGPLA